MPYHKDAGYVTSRVNKLTNGYCILYDGNLAGFEASNGRWVILCSDHGRVFGLTNKRIATAMLRDPVAWCESCRDMVDLEEAEYILTMRATRPATEQFRRLARLAVGDPEKCYLFQKLTGKQPEFFVDEKD